jgi:glycogen operon protein
MLWMVNASADDIEFTIPEARWGTEWHLAIDTATGEVSPAEPAQYLAGQTVKLIGRSTVVLRRSRDTEGGA